MSDQQVNESQSLIQELAHARRGMAYYQKQVDKLAKKVEKLGINPSGRGRRDPGMPKTPADFWVGLLGKRPKTHQQVIESALKALKMEDASAEMIRKLRLRWSVLLLDLIKNGRIVADGAGRERKFSLPA